MKVKCTETSIIAKNTGVEQKQVYQSAIVHLNTKELTPFEASMAIWYLATGKNNEQWMD